MKYRLEKNQRNAKTKLSIRQTSKKGIKVNGKVQQNCCNAKKRDNSANIVEFENSYCRMNH